jgi:hypothetical protein
MGMMTSSSVRERIEAEMQVRRHRARICHNCMHRNQLTKICGVDGSDTRVDIAEDKCPKKWSP